MSKEPRLTGPVLKVLGGFLDEPSEAVAGSDIRKLTGLSTGTLYPLLIRLERIGWLESYWENANPSEIGRPRKRFYLITPEGAVRAKEAIASLGLRDHVWAG